MKRLLPSLPGLAVLAACLLLSAPLYAGPGHDHDEPTAAAPSNAPKRLPDGSVFLPKPAQRQLDVRTVRVQREALPRTAELAGRVMMDPNAGGRVQSSIPGRLEAGPKGLPGIGQSVRKGEVLAYVMPTSGSIERSNQVAQLADLRSAKSLAERRPRSGRGRRREPDRAHRGARRWAQQPRVPRRARLGRHRQRQRGRGAARRCTRTRLRGRRPDAAAHRGGRLRPGSCLGRRGRKPRRRRQTGAADVPRCGTHPARAGPADELRRCQPVRVYVQSKSRVEGIPVPAGSLVRNPSNQTIVWVKARTERFEPRVVTTEPLDGTQVAVVGGLQPGERVVTRGATLVNQVR